MDRNDGSIILVGLPKMYVHTRNNIKTGFMQQASQEMRQEMSELLNTFTMKED